MPEIKNGVIADLYDASALTMEGVIQNCTRILEASDATVAGAGRRILNPMLSIFLGEQANAHINEIQDAYLSCWSDHANHLKVLRGAYTRQDIETAIFQSTQVSDRSLSTNTVRTVWFWDIMDDNFDTFFNCVKEPYAMPVATANKRVYFIFCSQRDTVSQEKTRQRLQEQLIPWAQENKHSLVVLSDATSSGILQVHGVAENYRLAASLMQIMNTAYSIDEDDLGKIMTFDLEQNSVFSASYHVCKKNSYDILGISFLQIIRRYRALGQRKNERYSYGNSVQERLCGNGRDYYNLIEDIFDETLSSICKADARLWGDMPAFPSVEELRAQMQGETRQGNFFTRLFSRSRTVYLEDVIAELGDFWTCIVKHYYTDPIEAYLESPEGSHAVQDHMYSRMTTALNYDEMHTLLQNESQLVQTLYDDLQSKLPRPAADQFRNPEEYLHATAMREAKLKVAQRLMKWLSEAMATLCSNAAGFDNLLQQVQNSLYEDQMERSIVRAYGNHMNTLIDNNPQLLTSHIRPSRSESELLQQLQSTFLDLLKTDVSRVYYMTLQADLQFRINNGAAADAENVIAECFHYDMKTAGRLPTLVPPVMKLYTIMNKNLELDNLAENVPEDAIGDRFLVSRSDRIERLGLFPVNPDAIMFSN